MRKHWILAGLLAALLLTAGIVCLKDSPKGTEDGSPTPYVK